MEDAPTLKHKRKSVLETAAETEQYYLEDESDSQPVIYMDHQSVQKLVASDHDVDGHADYDSDEDQSMSGCQEESESEDEEKLASQCHHPPENRKIKLSSF